MSFTIVWMKFGYNIYFIDLFVKLFHWKYIQNVYLNSMLLMFTLLWFMHYRTVRNSFILYMLDLKNLTHVFVSETFTAHVSCLHVVLRKSAWLLFLRKVVLMLLTHLDGITSQLIPKYVLILITNNCIHWIWPLPCWVQVY